MTKFLFKVYDDQENIIFTGCETFQANAFEFMGYEVKRFWDGVLI